MNVCIFGASSDFIDKKYIKSAYDLGASLAKKGHGLVFGGGACGVMGASARGFHENGGYILGVAPEFMSEYNLFSENCTDFKITKTMAERKTYMEDHADAFIIAPGGIGTYEEFFEVYTLKQLNRHSKAIAIFNPYGYYDDMIKMLRHTVSESFMQQESLDLVADFCEAKDLIEYLENYHATKTDVLKARYAFIKGKDCKGNE
ncbi:MAG: TIGR00730 family Rossman fold protein [Anaerotruncus sp.]|nr:TIGR00730 family Rossman fold protein [Anaerotruncus sp.]